MKRIRQRRKNDCGIAAVAMLLCGKFNYTRGDAYARAKEVMGSEGRTGIGKLTVALAKLKRPLRPGRMGVVPKGGLPALDRDALVSVQFVRSNSKHWMIWDQRRQCLLDPETEDSHWSEYHVLLQIEVAE